MPKRVRCGGPTLGLICSNCQKTIGHTSQSEASSGVRQKRHPRLVLRTCDTHEEQMRALGVHE